MQRLLISGYYGFDNAGDEAILASLVPAFKCSLSDVHITVISNNPALTRKEHDVNAIPRFGTFALLKEMARTDLFVSGGGSLLQDVTSLRSLLYYLAIIALAKAFGKKVMLFAQGFGPVNTRFGRKMVRKVLSNTDVATFRDPRSLEEVVALGVSGPRMEVTADPVFLLERHTDAEQKVRARQKAAEALESAGISSEGGPLVGVSLRPWKGASPDFVSVMAAALSELAQLGHRPVLLPFHTHEDLEFCRLVAGAAAQNIHVLEHKLDARAMMELVGRLDLLVGMRLHSLIFAVTRSVPCLALPYDPKVESFAEAAGIGIATVPTEPCAQKLVDAVIDVLGRKDAVSAGLVAQKSRLTESAELNFDLAKNLFLRP